MLSRNKIKNAVVNYPFSSRKQGYHSHINDWENGI